MNSQRESSQKCKSVLEVNVLKTSLSIIVKLILKIMKEAYLLTLASNIHPKTLLLFLPLSSCNCLWNLSLPHTYLYGFAFFLSTVWNVGDEIFQSGNILYILDCSPQNRGLQHFYTGAPKDLCRAELSLLLSMPGLFVQHMHTKSLCLTLPRNPGCVI